MPHELLSLLKTFSWGQVRHHPWRNAVAVMAVTLGVALAFAVQLINASALSEFALATRAVNGEPDLILRSAQSTFDESAFGLVAQQPQVAVASPVLEVDTYALAPNGQRVALRVLGVDALLVAQVSLGLMPLPQMQTGNPAAASPPSRPHDKPGDARAADADRFAIFSPGSIFLNTAAQAALQPTAGAEAQDVQVQSGMRMLALRVAGRVAAPGAPLAVMDIGAAQDLLGRQGHLSRIDVKLQAGADAAQVTQALQATPGWLADLRAQAPAQAASRLDNLSRAYRVNLTALALVALFTGAFLVFSVLSLSVAQRSQQFALLGVLGLTRGQRLRLVLMESAVLGVVGSALGIGLGTLLAAASLQFLGGDLGGGYFAGSTPRLQWQGGAAMLYAGLGVVAALVGGWWPARQAQDLQPAQALKGLGGQHGKAASPWVGVILIALGLALTGAPAVFGIPLAAYASIALLLVGGIALLPWVIGLLLNRLSQRMTAHLLPLLAIERARRVRMSASVAVSGVVASLSLAVALTVMVASFRQSVTQWLDVVLPAALYVRTASSASASDTAFFTPEFVAAVRTVPGVARMATLRTRLLQLDPARPAVALLARDLDSPDQVLPMVAPALPVPAGQIGIYVSEAMADLYQARPGQPFPLLNSAIAPVNTQELATYFVAGVWRDYARQGGTIAMRKADFIRLTGDIRVGDMALWLDDAANVAQVQQSIRAIDGGVWAGLVEFAVPGDIRAVSLKIFDRSFAVTYWLQAVAIGIGLFGVAANFSAQVLARRKEFGLLVHLGLTRRQILAVVAGEGLAWTACGALAGLGLGLLVSAVLVHVVNPQSFHWTMDLTLPWPRLLALCGAVIVAGTVTAWLAARAAAGRDAVLAVKEDW
jgi:putative ABC transport system permease protein